MTVLAIFTLQIPFQYISIQVLKIYFEYDYTNNYNV